MGLGVGGMVRWSAPMVSEHLKKVTFVSEKMASFSASVRCGFSETMAGGRVE